MKHAVFATARNEDQAHKVVDQLRTLGFSSQEISVILPQNVHAQAGQGQAPKKPANPNDKQNIHGQSQQHGAQGQHGVQGQTKSAGSFPNSNVSLKSLNIKENDIRKYEDVIKNGQIVIAAQSDNNDKLEKAQEYFKKEGLSNISTNREGAKSGH